MSVAHLAGGIVLQLPLLSRSSGWTKGDLAPDELDDFARAVHLQGAFAGHAENHALSRLVALDDAANPSLAKVQLIIG